MTALVVLLGLAIALLGLLVVGLLRSHAEILRRLHELGVGLDDPAVPGAGVIEAAATPAAAPNGRPAADVAGNTPQGEVAAVGIVGASHHTLVAFLSSGCLTCADFWKAFAKVDALRLPPDTRPLIVTRSADAESLSAIQRVAPPEVTVVMSTDAWVDFDVPGSPYFVLVDGPRGRVVAEGTADNWEDARRLLTQDDPRPGPRPSRIRNRRAATTRDPDRREKVDVELLAAGIGPGHPSLYPEEQDEA